MAKNCKNCTPPPEKPAKSTKEADELVALENKIAKIARDSAPQPRYKNDARRMR